MSTPGRGDAVRAALARLRSASRYGGVARDAISKLPAALRLVREHGRPAAVVYFGGAPGDDLLLTPVLRAMDAERAGPLWVMSAHASLFAGNPHVAATLPFDDGLARALSALGVRRLRLRYHDYLPSQDRSLAPDDHIVRLMALRAGVRGPVDVAPEVFLTEAEIEAGRIAPRQVAIQSTALGAGMAIRNKEWFPERFQQVVDRLSGGVQFVQLGLASDPPLAGAVDLRGRTTLREAGAVLANSTAFVGLVGFLMHMARAVRTPSVIVYGGREHPSQSGYAENPNLCSPVPCSPCWLWSRCDFGRMCLDRITADDVVAALNEVLEARDDSGRSDR
ncbi:MAG: hypothetical protein JWM27_513 [Gemmatimonadetes bacterium]|nr:hypothetical protein [Gemmatimonadota bacterium]